jgi:hypothetical protein
MTRWYREWCLGLNDRKGNMVTLDELDAISKYHKNPGFSSLYAFKEEDAKQILGNGHSRGIGDFTPYSDFLAIDIDSGKESDLEFAENALKGYETEVWVSGKKGYHIILKHALIGDKRLPYSQAQWVKERGIACDFSLYQASRIFRLPRCIHQDTKRRKTLLRTSEGTSIDLPLLDRPKQEVVFSFGEKSDYKSALGRLWSFAEQGVSDGERNNRFWQMATELIQAGFDVETVRGVLSHINNMQSSPLNDREFNITISSAGRGK